MIALSVAVRTARLQQIVDAIDAGSGPGELRLYTGTRPAAGGTPSGALQVSIPLASPCGVAAAAILTFTNGVEGLRVAEDTITWGRFTDSAGTYVMDATVGSDISITNVNGFLGSFVRITSGVMGE